MRLSKSIEVSNRFVRRAKKKKINKKLMIKLRKRKRRLSTVFGGKQTNRKLFGLAKNHK